MKFEEIERRASFLIADIGIKKLPIPVNEIAEKKGLLIRAFDFGNDASGALIIENGKGVIGFNPNDNKVRQRFTIAHEIGHFILHQPFSNIFFDNTSNFSIQYRSSKLSKNDRHEREANIFAAALLMPKTLIYSEIKKSKLDLSDEKCLKMLAKIFNVSTTAMAIRIADLHIFEKVY